MTQRKRTNKKPSESIYCFSPYGFNNTEIEHNSHKRERDVSVTRGENENNLPPMEIKAFPNGQDN